MATQDGGEPEPSLHPAAHTPPGECDTHPTAAPYQGHQCVLLCSPGGESEDKALTKIKKTAFGEVWRIMLELKWMFNISASIRCYNTQAKILSIKGPILYYIFARKYFIRPSLNMYLKFVQENSSQKRQPVPETPYEPY